MGLRLRCLLVAAFLCGMAAAAHAQGCEHDICLEGTPLVSGCDPCVTAICAVDTFCCDFDWDNTCVEQVGTVCGLNVCGACAHALCETGEPLDASCNTCAADVCAADPICCSSQWDATCVALIDTACDAVSCTQGADDCQSAVVLDNSVVRERVMGTLVGMSGDGCTSEGDSCNNADVWYSYTVPFDGRLHYANSCGTEHSFGTDTVLSVHSDCPGVVGNEVLSNDDWMFGPDPLACVGIHPERLLDSAVIFPYIGPGETLKLRISHANGFPEGAYQVYVPEPSSLLLRCVGLAAVVALSRWGLRRRGRTPSA